jgi:hypothetical protein
MLGLFSCLSGFAQERKFDAHSQFGFLHQIDMNSPNYDWGLKIGLGASKEYKLGRLSLDAELLSMSNDNGENDFGGRSLAFKLNFLFKTWAIKDKHLYLGPGLGVFFPISYSYGAANGYSFKALYPIQISNKSFDLVYDFDINIYGYFRNSLGISYRF